MKKQGYVLSVLWVILLIFNFSCSKGSDKKSQPGKNPVVVDPKVPLEVLEAKSEIVSDTSSIVRGKVVGNVNEVIDCQLVTPLDFDIVNKVERREITVSKLSSSSSGSLTNFLGKIRFFEILFGGNSTAAQGISLINEKGVLVLGQEEKVSLPTISTSNLSNVDPESLLSPQLMQEFYTVHASAKEPANKDLVIVSVKSGDSVTKSIFLLKDRKVIGIALSKQVGHTNLKACVTEIKK